MSSVTGTVSGVPLTEHDEENTIWSTPARSRASTNCTVPATLFIQYRVGCCIDSPTLLYAAKCTAWVTPWSAQVPSDRIPVGDVGDHQRHAGDRLRIAELERVEDDDVDPVGLEAADRVRADVAGAAGDENAHWKSLLIAGEARGSRRRRLEGVTFDRDPRIAVVLGAGGVVGHAFHVGVLSTLADEFGWDARRARLVIGTSAGSVVGAACEPGLVRSTCVVAWPASACRRKGRCWSAAARPPWPPSAASTRASTAADVDRAEETAFGTIARRLRIASPERVRRALREPWRVTPGSLVSAVLPPGRRPTAHLRVPYDAMIGESWPDTSLWIVAVDLDVGPRVVFGRPGAPPVTVGAGGRGIVRDPRLLRAGDHRGRPVRRRCACTRPPTPTSSPNSTRRPISSSSSPRCPPSQLRVAANPNSLVASTRPPPGRRRGRWAADQGTDHRDVPTDGR